MKKKSIKNIVILLTALLILIGVIFGTIYGIKYLLSVDRITKKIKNRLETNGYFIYEKHEDGSIGIVGLTDEGKDQEYLVIPSTIDGVMVSYIGSSGLTATAVEQKYGNYNINDEKYEYIYSNFNSEKLRKIYIISALVIEHYPYGLENPFKPSPNFEACMIVTNENINIKAYQFTYYTTKIKDGPTANVSYYYNYKEAPNSGYYWIDNYEGTKITFIPENPQREGYIFDGWYKESSCENVWDFENDTVSDKMYADGENEFNETCLYAKWREV